MQPAGDDEAGTVPPEDWHELRAVRLALDVLMAHMPDALAGTGVAAGLWPLHDELSALEARELASAGVPRCYLVIRPVSLVAPPDSETMARISAAVRTLAGLGMLTGLQFAGPGGSDLPDGFARHLLGGR